ncbi:hypothetical protein, partial [Pseudomonas sp. OA65]|uniref:hypothetical protein n=1 Tax=Pseudomonas sp. OA65 TaxID=2818431 RepID=UPI001A9E79CA
EIFTFGRGFLTRISRSSVQKRRFHRSMAMQFGQTDFFNRIGRLLPVETGSNRPLQPVSTGRNRPEAACHADRLLLTEIGIDVKSPPPKNQLA